jgi:hypothetical protein
LIWLVLGSHSRDKIPDVVGRYATNPPVIGVFPKDILFPLTTEETTFVHNGAYKNLLTAFEQAYLKK